MCPRVGTLQCSSWFFLADDDDRNCNRARPYICIVAYVVGEKQGMILERAFKQGETLRMETELDMDAELRVARDYQQQVAGDDAEQKNERKAMKEVGLARARELGWPNTYVFTKALGEMMLARELGGVVPAVIVRPSIITSIHKEPLPGWMEGTRTIDAILIGYAKQSLSCFLADLQLTMDVVCIRCAHHAWERYVTYDTDAWPRTTCRSPGTWW